ncbi:hypothetical protein GCM10027345_30860 [Hymenobacter daeguensis]
MAESADQWGGGLWAASGPAPQASARAAATPNPPQAISIERRKPDIKDRLSRAGAPLSRPPARTF